MKALNVNQMINLNGGVTEAEYCATLQTIINNGGGVPGVSDFFYQYHNCAYWNAQQ